MRQVAHALLTRPPLSLLKILPKLHQRLISVRLACVRHAASVHPEPGSNSHVKISSIPARTKTLAFVLSVITFWSNIRNRILVSVNITYATITWRGILEPSNHC